MDGIYYSVDELAARWSVHPNTVRNMRGTDANFPPSRSMTNKLRFRRDEVLAFEAARGMTFTDRFEQSEAAARAAQMQNTAA